METVVTEPTLSEGCTVSMGIQQDQLSGSQESGLWTFLILPCRQLSSKTSQPATRPKLVFQFVADIGLRRGGSST